MSAMKAYYERMSWHDAGYARQPDERTATAQESVCLYRAYNEFGPRLSNCFFTPSLRGADIGHLTAEILETELNAALWGNNFERVAVFKIVDSGKCGLTCTATPTTEFTPPKPVTQTPIAELAPTASTPIVSTPPKPVVPVAPPIVRNTTVVATPESVRKK